MKVIIIGGGACGASAAARIRRLDEKAEVVILEKTNEISIANCGLPYYTSGVINDREKMLVSSPEKFKSWFNIDVRLNSEVIGIDVESKNVILKNGEKLSYDKLVLAQGANPILPDFEGMPKDRVFTVRTLYDADRIKDFIRNNNIQKAVVIGGGFIGIEMAENLAEMGLKTTLIEAQNQILAPVDYEAAAFVQNEMRDNGVELILSDAVKEFAGNKIVLNSQKEVEFDIVIMAIGVKPELGLAKSIGLDIERGIIVNERMETSVPDIYAGGDGVVVKDFVTDENTFIPLAGPANRQGRIIADNICGGKYRGKYGGKYEGKYEGDKADEGLSVYKKSQGSSVLKVFGMTAAAVGNNEKQLRAKGISYWKTIIFGRDHAGYYPDSVQIMFKLLFTPEGKILGAQAVGQDGVEKRIDVVSSVMRNGGGVQELLDSELCYAPPYSSAKDPVNILGMSADNILKGFVKPAFFEDIEGSLLVDVRPEMVFKINTIEGAINIPIDKLRVRLEEIPRDKKVVLFCNTGHTSYIAARILEQYGFTNVYSLMGGITLYKEIIKDRRGKVEVREKIPAANTLSAAFKIDATGLQCPGPIMKVASEISHINVGEVLEVIATDRGFKSDIAAWCESTGNSLLELESDKKTIKAVIQKGSVGIKKEKSGTAQTIVVFSNDLDKALAALIIANGARAAGAEVTLFFTFWGLNILRKPKGNAKKGFIDTMFGLMMPKGADKLTLSKMNMGGAGSLMMKWVMKQKNVSTLGELIEQAQKSGVKFIACNMSMDVMGIKPEELIDGVEIGGVAKYIHESSSANSNLFI